MVGTQYGTRSQRKFFSLACSSVLVSILVVYVSQMPPKYVSLEPSTLS